MLQRLSAFLFKNQTLKQTIAKNTFWLFFGEIIGRLAKIAIVIYAARVLGVENWGVFSYTITVAAVFMIFSDIGLNAILTRETSKNPELREKYLSTALFIKIALLVFSASLIIFVAPNFTKLEQAKPLLLLAALLFIIDNLREFGFSVNRALEKMEQEAFVKILINFLMTALGFFFLIKFTSPSSLLIAYIIASFIGFLLILWFLRNYFKNLIHHFNKKLIKPILSSAWPFALFGLLSTIMINTDILMLGWFKTAKDVGLYSIAQKPIQIFYIIPILITTAAFPAIAKLAQKDDTRLRNIMEKSISFLLMIGLPIFAGGLILGKEIITVLFGNEYLLATAPFKILLITILIFFPITLINYAIFAYDKQKSIVKFLVVGALGNIALNYLLIPNYGIIGAAIATVFMQILINTLIWQKMKKINNFKIFPYLKKIIIAAILMALLVILLKYLKINFYINIISAVLFYFIILRILKESLLREVETILKLKI